jgi:hypothetical protein
MLLGPGVEPAACTPAEASDKPTAAKPIATAVTGRERTKRTIVLGPSTFPD